jgi:hypothetical protein
MIQIAAILKLHRGAVAGVFMAAVAVVAAGCSNSSTPTTTTTSSPAASSTTSTTAAAATSSTTTTTAAPTTTTSGSSLASSLLGKFQSGEHATFIASYRVTSGASNELTTLTIAQQSPDQVFEGSTKSGTFELLTLGTKSYICTKSSATSTCFGSGASNPEADLFALYEPSKYLPYFQAAASAAGGHTSVSTKSVNGYSLSCITISGATGENGTGTFCVTSQGVLGYVAWTGTKAADSGSFEITSYSSTVPASEFTLPATPTTLPAGA